MWLGDQMTSWDDKDGLQSAITGLLSSGLSGFSLNHGDIGGWFGVTIKVGITLFSIERSKELFLRWTEMFAFTLVFRTHDGVNADKNVQLYTDNETYQHFATFAKVYAALAFYRTTLMQEAATKGYPIVRHPLLHYPTDMTAVNLQYQWMLGSEFMVAPVTEPGQTTKVVYLPIGNSWIHVWTGTVYVGGQSVPVNAPIGKPPVFYVQGSSVGAQFIVNLKESGVLES